MNHRWCILASPRSGSTFLEERIFNQIKPQESTVPAWKLAEFLHWEWYTYRNAGKIINGISTFDSEIRTKHRNYVLKIITGADIPMTMRIFPQHWHKDYIDLDEFFTTLQKNKFRFIHLRRNFKDRMISLCVAQATEYWHTANRELDNNKGEPASEDNKATISMEILAKNYYDMRMTDFYLEQFVKTFPGEIINYETMQEDCERIGIIDVVPPIYQKTYSADYSNLISNFAEVEAFINGF